MMTNEKQIKELLSDYYDGTSLNNANLVRLYLHTRQTADLLQDLGPEYRVSFKELNRVSMNLYDYITARGLKVER